MSTLDTLVKAREIAASDRWDTAMLCTTDGRVCALGAVGAALGWTPKFMLNSSDSETYDVLAKHPAVHALSAALPDERRGARNEWDVINFNDDVRGISEGDYEAHHAKVVDLFDRAIADERARIQEQDAGQPVEPLTAVAPAVLTKESQ